MVGYSVERKRELHVRQLLLRGGGGALAGGNTKGQATDQVQLADPRPWLQDRSRFLRGRNSRGRRGV